MRTGPGSGAAARPGDCRPPGTGDPDNALSPHLRAAASKRRALLPEASSAALSWPWSPPSTPMRARLLCIELGLNTDGPLPPRAGWSSEARPALGRSCVPRIPRQAHFRVPVVIPAPSTASRVLTTEDTCSTADRTHTPFRLTRTHRRCPARALGCVPSMRSALTGPRTRDSFVPAPAAHTRASARRGSPGRCRPRAGSGPGLLGLVAARSSRRPWSARHSSSCSRRENSSPGSSWRLHTEQRKHSMWYTLSRARITRSLLLKPTWHLAHLMPNSLCAQGRASARGRGPGPGGQRPSPSAGPAVRAAHLT